MLRASSPFIIPATPHLENSAHAVLFNLYYLFSSSTAEIAKPGEIILSSISELSFLIRGAVAIQISMEDNKYKIKEDFFFLYPLCIHTLTHTHCFP